MSELGRYRYRMLYSKTEAMRYTSHLDLHRTWERSMRRAGLPLAYTQGYNPRPRLNLGHALPLGFTSEYELADFWLETKLDARQVRQTLRQALPPGLRIHQVSHSAPRQAAIQQQVASSQYRVRLIDGPSLQELQETTDALLQAQSLPRNRRGKDYDLRPLIESLEVQRVQDEPVLMMQLSAREGATGRPDEVLLAMGLDPALAKIHRKRQILQTIV